MVLLIALFTGLSSCKPNDKSVDTTVDKSEFLHESEKEPKLVLAQWTFNKDLFAGKMTTFDFVNTAGEFGVEGVEYVSQFFDDKVEDDAYLSKLKSTAQKAGIKNTMILVDVLESRLGATDSEERRRSIEAHKKWIIAASKLDCPNIRVNAHGDGSADETMDNIFESVKELSSFGKKYKVGVTIENHGQYSSDGKWLTELLEKLVPYGVGCVADFDNWCIEREDGKLWGSKCIKEYDRYQGIKELLPTAKSISLKAFEFDENGDAVKTDFKKMFELIRTAQYDEYLAVEFEGHDLDPVIGVRNTLKLVEKYY